MCAGAGLRMWGAMRASRREHNAVGLCRYCNVDAVLHQQRCAAAQHLMQQHRCII